MSVCIAYFIVVCAFFIFFEWKDYGKEKTTDFFDRRFTSII